MKILVINCGSSSLKYQLIDMENESVMAKGLCERIGIEGSFYRQWQRKRKQLRKLFQQQLFLICSSSFTEDRRSIRLGNVDRRSRSSGRSFCSTEEERGLIRPKGP